MRCFAVVPAGGRSRRFGTPKLLAPWRGQPLLALVLRALARVACRVVVPCTPAVPDLAAVVSGAGATPLELPRETPDMKATILHGLAWLEQHEQPSEGDVWLLAPGDAPGLSEVLLREMVVTAQQDQAVDFVVPTFAGRRGHPLLVRWRQVAAVRGLPPAEGINRLLAQAGPRLREVVAPSAGILVDVDTPADLARWQAEVKSNDSP